MKMCLGNTPINFVNLGTDTDDATLVASDLQAGVTAYAKGRKVTGTGKSFSFAIYGTCKTNRLNVAPETINVIQIGSFQYPIKMTIPFKDMRIHDFSTAQQMAEVTIDGIIYPIIVSMQNGLLNITCDQTIDIELFYGRDEYI